MEVKKIITGVVRLFSSVFSATDQRTFFFQFKKNQKLSFSAILIGRVSSSAQQRNQLRIIFLSNPSQT